MLVQPGVNVVDNLVGRDFSPRRAAHILNRSVRHLQTLKLLLAMAWATSSMLR
jgi:hypothetical protein